MQSAMLECGDKKDRRNTLRESELLNGIDYVEYNRIEGDEEGKGLLYLYLIHKASTDLFQEFGKDDAGRHVSISGGRRVPVVEATSAEIIVADDKDDDYIKITVIEPNDFSNYTLHLVALDASRQQTSFPMAGIDPRYAEISVCLLYTSPSPRDPP